VELGYVRIVKRRRVLAFCAVNVMVVDLSGHLPDPG
jgi:hypothetical protein